MIRKIYCDNSATTKVYPEVIREINKYLKMEWGNPSSIYCRGRNAKIAIEDARERIAKILNCLPEEIYFTSGGSESDNIVIKGLAKKDKTMIVSEFEHPAILNACKRLEEDGYKIVYMKKTDDFWNIDEKKNINLISFMLVNNETGTIFPINEFKEYKKSFIVHTDAVQAVGKIELDVKKLGVDAMSLSGHKFGAPKGIGVLYLRKGIECKPLIDGGGQENGLRSGTENVPYIMGIAKALEITYKNFEKKNKKMKEFDEYFIKQLQLNIPEVQLNHFGERCSGVINLRFDGIDAQNLLLYLDRYGIYVSAGSACHSDSNTPSHVLKAFGLTDEEALSSLRFSFKKPLSRRQVKRLIKVLKQGIALQKQLTT